MTVGELAERIDVRELDEWAEYERGYASRTEQLLAVLCAMFYNANRDPKRSRSLDSGDFLGIPKPRAAGDRVQRAFMAWAKSRGSDIPDANRRA